MMKVIFEFSESEITVIVFLSALAGWLIGVMASVSHYAKEKEQKLFDDFLNDKT